MSIKISKCYQTQGVTIVTSFCPLPYLLISLKYLSFFFIVKLTKIFNFTIFIKYIWLNFYVKNKQNNLDSTYFYYHDNKNRLEDEFDIYFTYFLYFYVVILFRKKKKKIDKFSLIYQILKSKD